MLHKFCRWANWILDGIIYNWKFLVFFICNKSQKFCKKWMLLLFVKKVMIAYDHNKEN